MSAFGERVRGCRSGQPFNIAPVQGGPGKRNNRNGQANVPIARANCGSTRSEQRDRGEIQSGTEQRRQSEPENGANYKANIDKPIFVPGWCALEMHGAGDWFTVADVAVLGSVAVWNYDRFPVRSTLHAH
jgi:hypothetical protein